VNCKQLTSCRDW